MSTAVENKFKRGVENSRRGSRRGLVIKPGAVLRARTEAGLSLAEVAGTEVSRVAIHRIERGHSRPTMRTLELIAERTGKPVTWFLESPLFDLPPESGLLELEQRVLDEQFESAVEAGTRLLERPLDRATTAQVRLFMGEALVWLGRSGQALDLLMTARMEFDRSGDRMREVSAMDWEAMALCMLQRPEALDLAQRALAACRGLGVTPIPIEVRILSHLGSIHVLRHEWDEAVGSYEQAIQRAGSMRDLRRLGLMYANLAIAYGYSGQPERGIGYAHRSLALHQLHRDRLSLARTQNNMAMLYLQLGRLDDADAAARQAVDGFLALGVDSQRSQTLLTQAEINLAQGRLRDCSERLAEAEALCLELDEQLPLATVHELRAQLLAARGDDAGSDAEFLAATAVLERAGSAERLAACAATFARVLHGRGELAAAYTWMERALVSGRPHLIERERSLRYLTG
ncbi:MAG: tetratricopeptide repeat protein [Candidatus Dormibacteraceae bacterium]